MGYGKKNTNRGQAIARNTERYKNLAAKVDALEKEDRALRKALALEEGRRRLAVMGLTHRLEQLERPLRRKVADYFVALYSKLRAKLKKEPAPNFAVVDTPSSSATDPERKGPELEIVEAPRAQGKTTEAQRRAAELVSPPPAAGGMATASLELEAEKGKNNADK